MCSMLLLYIRHHMLQWARCCQEDAANQIWEHKLSCHSMDIYSTSACSTNDML